MSDQQADDAASDQEIVRRTLAGERNAFELLFLRYERAIYLYLLRIARVQEDAEDLTQETFLHAYRGLAGYKLDQPFRPWLFKIATNAALSSRRRKTLPTLSLDDENHVAERGAASLGCALGEETPAQKMTRQEEIDQLQQALAALSPEDAALIHLHYFEGIKFKEIGEILGRTPGSIAVALHRLRHRLRETIFGKADGEKELANDGLPGSRQGH